MNNNMTIVSAICVIGAVILAAMNRDGVHVAALIGLAGTLAGRGKGA